MVSFPHYMQTTSRPTFACDAMLGGLARWLRAAGYDASWHPGIEDWDLIRIAQGEGRMLLTSDNGIFRVGIVRDGDVPALLIPHGLRKREQLRRVLRQLNLPILQPRCMACGGQLREATREEIEARVPERSRAWLDQFFQCTRCGQVFWQATHWQKIASVLENL
jgi:uncharacterized protein with PIN domain